MNFIFAGVTFFLVWTVTDSRASSCEELASQGNCTFYPQCLEKRVPCGNDGYAMGFGHKYCVGFTDAILKFDAAGKTFITKTRSCLTTAMIQSDVYEDSSSCADIASFGFASHPQCYVDAGFCPAIGENVDNLYVLFTTISIKDLLRPQIISAMQETLKICSDKGYNLIVHDIKEIIQKIFG